MYNPVPNGQQVWANAPVATPSAYEYEAAPQAQAAARHDSGPGAGAGPGPGAAAPAARPLPQPGLANRAGGGAEAGGSADAEPARPRTADELSSSQVHFPFVLVCAGAGV